MPRVNSGDPIYLSQQLFDGDTTKHVRVRLYNRFNTEISGSPVALAHVANGLYVDNGTVNMPNTAIIRAQAQVFDDSGFTTPSDGYSIALDTYELDTDTGGGGGGSTTVVVPLNYIVGIIDEANPEPPLLTDTTTLVGLVEEDS